MSAVNRHVRASSPSGCAFVYFTVEDSPSVSQVQGVWKQVAGGGNKSEDNGVWSKTKRWNGRMKRN